jgi:hypothetical protein
MNDICQLLVDKLRNGHHTQNHQWSSHPDNNMGKSRNDDLNKINQFEQRDSFF